MEDQKAGFEKLLAENAETTKDLEEYKESLKKQLETEKQTAEVILKEKDVAFGTLFNELTALRLQKEALQKEVESLKNEVAVNVAGINSVEEQKKALAQLVDKNGKGKLNPRNVGQY